LESSPASARRRWRKRGTRRRKTDGELRRRLVFDWASSPPLAVTERLNVEEL